MVASSYPFLGVVATVVLVCVSLVFIWIVVVLFGDLFARDDLDGWSKAGWTTLLVFVPFVGAIVYILARPQPVGNEGGRLVERPHVSALVDGVADELAKLRRLREEGTIDDDEFEELKRRTIATG